MRSRQTISRIAPLLFAALAACAASGVANAQYKWVDARGRIGYGDRLPDGDVKVLAGPNGPVASVASGGASELPYALKSAADRYPVVFYTTSDCTPCEPARKYLVTRGIPFLEKTVRSDAEAQAFRRLGFSEVGFPSISVGNDKAVGYEVGAWDRMLSAAGYPRRSLLPKGYRHAAAQPLVAQARLATGGKDNPPAPGRARERTAQIEPESRLLAPSSTPNFRF